MERAGTCDHCGAVARKLITCELCGARVCPDHKNDAGCAVCAGGRTTGGGTDTNDARKMERS